MNPCFKCTMMYMPLICLSLSRNSVSQVFSITKEWKERLSLVTMLYSRYGDIEVRKRGREIHLQRTYHYCLKCNACMLEIPVDIWSLIIDEVARLPSGNSESWSNRTSELAKVAQICKATEVSLSERLSFGDHTRRN
jgi:hypothetical protein